MQRNSLVDKIKKCNRKYNLYIIIIPFLIILSLFILLVSASEDSLNLIESVRVFLTQKLGVYYLAFGVAFVIIAAVMAFSKIGKIRLGNPDSKPMSNFTWGGLIFTSTMAADILFYALHEWTNYYGMQALDTTGSLADQSLMWAETYPLFHWGITPWIFYLVPAVCYAFMFYVNNRRTSQRISEACRPLLKSSTDKFLGKLVDVLMVLGLLLGTSTTFSVATPLITALICKLFGLQLTNLITIIVLIIIAGVYTLGVIGGFKSIDLISKLAVILTSLLLALFFIFGGPQFILESGFEGIGNMVSNFFRMSTWMDPARVTNIPQDYTVFNWSYWIAWAVATPLFIAKISKGRTIKQLILGGLLAGLLGTFTSFIVLGGTGMNMQVSGNLDIVAMIQSGVSASEVIVEIISMLPMAEIIMVLLVVSMILLYVTTFDTIVHTMASYMTRKLDLDEEPTRGAKLFWSLIFIILPIALIFSESSVQGLKAMSIIGALPLSIVFIVVVISFFKSYKNYKITNKMVDSIMRDLALSEITNHILKNVEDKIISDGKDGSMVSGEEDGGIVS